MQIKSFIKENWNKIIAVIAVIILYVTYAVSDIKCPIRYITGISCMGCGMSRALVSALTFHFRESFYYHPLWPLVPVWAVLLIFRKKINKNLFYVLIGVTVVAFTVVYFMRMFDPHNHVVVCSPQNSIVGKFYNILK